MNYLVVDKQSNLIVEVISGTAAKTENDRYKLHQVNERGLDQYYKLASSRPTLVDIGELMAKSSYVKDVVMNGRSGSDKTIIPRYR